jgi:serine/threonine protein kinase
LLLRILKVASDDVWQAWKHEVEVLTRLRGTPRVAELLTAHEEWSRAPLVAYRYVDLRATVRHYLAAFPDSVEPLLKVTEDALMLLADLHERGVVHGRLTPDALFVDSAGGVVLVDLGRVTAASEPGLSRYGYRRRPLEGEDEPQDDLYAWGMVMRSCLKGHPLEGESIDELKTRLSVGNLPLDVGVAPEWVKKSAKEVMAFIGKLLSGQFDSAKAALKGLRTFHKPKLATEPLEVLTEHGVELEATLGQGGMGTVYRGRFKSTGEQVAIKVMMGDASRDRFLAEASMLEKLKHPNIVRYRDLYDWEEEDETSYILLMEYAPGLPFDVWFEMVGRDVRRLGPVFAQVLETLAYIHEKGYVHRDIKPANMMVGPGDQLKLLDFGLVKDQERHLTKTGEGLGTLTYMAPEQVREAAKVDGRADVYSAGVLLAKLMCGTSRFAAEAQMQTFESLFQSDGFLGAREQGIIVPGPVPAGMVAYLERVVAAGPKDRFASARVALQVWNRLVDAGCIRGGQQDLYPRVGLHNRAPALRQVWSNSLVDYTPRSVVVYGPPGVGKTRVLQEHLGWVLVQDEANVLTADSLKRLAEQLGVEASSDGIAAELEQRAANRPLLVYLDNNVASTDEATEDLLARVGQSKK